MERRPTWTAWMAPAATAALAGAAYGQTLPARLEAPRLAAMGAPVVACFAEGTDPRYIEAISRFLDLQNQIYFGPDYYLGSRWPGTAGQPRALTWSFVPDGLSITPGSGEPTAPSDLFAQMDAAFASQGGRTVWISRFQQVFDRYTQITGITYTRIRHNNNDWDDGAAWGSAGSASRGDIRIAMHPIDGQGDVLGYNYYPSNGDMVLDSADVQFFASSTNQHRFLRNLVAHEHGHGLGLQHVCSADSLILMEPLISTAYDGPRQDDIRGLHRHYGGPGEPNSTAATARGLGLLISGSPITAGTVPSPLTGANDPNAANCSIYGDGDTDWYSFSVDTATTLNVTVTPVGSTYDNSAQQANGSCVTTTSINALTVADLAVAVYATNGTTVLASANLAAAGQQETLTGVVLPAAGTYYVRVTEEGAPSGSQLYRLTLTAVCPTAPVIQQHPASQTVYNGDNVTLTVVATNALAYRWYKNGVALNNSSRISGVTTPTLRIAAAQSSDQGTYSVQITGDCANAASNSATLTVACYPNCDGSSTAPILNVVDYTCFFNRFVMGDTYCNCDGSTEPPILNIYDLICFQERYRNGCP